MSISREHHLVAGDVISVMAVLDMSCEPDDHFIHARIGGQYGELIHVVRADASLVRTCVRVGDTVRPAEAPEEADEGWPTGTVVAIMGDRAWVNWGLHDDAVLDLTAVRRVCLRFPPAPAASEG